MCNVVHFDSVSYSSPDWFWWLQPLNTERPLYDSNIFSAGTARVNKTDKVLVSTECGVGVCGGDGGGGD